MDGIFTKNVAFIESDAQESSISSSLNLSTLFSTKRCFALLCTRILRMYDKKERTNGGRSVRIVRPVDVLFLSESG